ncbi:MAG: hypothetical protein ACOC8A_02290 [bacterium]
MRWSPRALAPAFCVVTQQMPRNHGVNGLRVPWEIVPAVQDAS